VLLIGANGEQLGVKPLPEALATAREEELDLVEVAPNANPPVCRIMNYGRYKYEQEQRRKESRKKATNVVVKEMKFRPKIDEHDYETKMKHVERFLAEGSKVKLTIMFRGREVFHPELGLRILERVADQLVSTLSHGQQRQLEIGMALAGAPRFILFDEPAAGLSPAERRELIEILTSLPAHIGYIIIEHDMDVALRVVESVTMMHNGRVFKEGLPQEIESDPEVQELYLGGGHE